mmetsp:Transcript_26712/g.44654  ORF Transcript_26712/g.44654 Transcript_26712/m.44654 type:complete len:127 (+) Transcript_26712:155-535(+)|eukprot:CAMPEP_0174975782 /NCGR_PEP_ID=MMETSP0004_2-20121128/12640_1 /TAXON_ID=420556 /ORGANISM="Ochromonas sp., Strain CCMP1393" /LENGTH=126 /DNA_ID=CAMNT_0016226683 /DNA_START=119 /DNA_END=499 /DNA_ORIENTATION=-
MGNIASKKNKDGKENVALEQKEDSISAVAETIPSGDVKLKMVRLQHPGSCSGMFWRGDPETGARPPSNDNWPKNGAILQGTGPHWVKGVAYFKVSALQQAGKKGFKKIPEGTWMLYDQGGKLLFDC